MAYFALVPAAGSGSRMGGGPTGTLPKQYLPLAGRPILRRAIDLRNPYVDALSFIQARFLAELRAQRRKVFVDLKFFDIPETVARAVKSLAERGADFCTVHGNQAIMEAAAKSKSGNLRVLAVTALTSLDRGDLDDLG